MHSVFASTVNAAPAASVLLFDVGSATLIFAAALAAFCLALVAARELARPRPHGAPSPRSGGYRGVGATSRLARQGA